MKTSERHEFIRQRKEVYAVKQLCRILGVSESGYYRWLRNREKPSARKLLSVKIQEILSEHPDNDNYGIDRMRLALLCRGIAVSRATVYRAMKESGWLHKRRRPHGITKADTAVKFHQNFPRNYYNYYLLHNPIPLE